MQHFHPFFIPDSARPILFPNKLCWKYCLTDVDESYLWVIAFYCSMDTPITMPNPVRYIRTELNVVSLD